jgi:replicative DNA helicase
MQRLSRLRSRFDEIRMPFDEEAERAAVGAVLVAPARYAKRIARKLWREHFYLEQHGWLWDRTTYAIGKVEWDDVVDVYRWLRKDRWCDRYHDRFGGSLPALVASCLESGFWWHGIYYCDRVLVAAKARARIKRAAGELAEAMNVAQSGWHRRNW